MVTGSAPCGRGTGTRTGTENRHRLSVGHAPQNRITTRVSAFSGLRRGPGATVGRREPVRRHGLPVSQSPAPTRAPGGVAMLGRRTDHCRGKKAVRVKVRDVAIPRRAGWGLLNMMLEATPFGH